MRKSDKHLVSCSNYSGLLSPKPETPNQPNQNIGRRQSLAFDAVEPRVSSELRAFIGLRVEGIGFGSDKQEQLTAKKRQLRELLD